MKLPVTRQGRAAAAVALTPGRPSRQRGVRDFTVESGADENTRCKSKVTQKVKCWGLNVQQRDQKSKEIKANSILKRRDQKALEKSF